MTQTHMTLPNGDTLYVGDYGITRDGRKVGPIRFNKIRNLAGWGDSASKVCMKTGAVFAHAFKEHGLDIIAKWVDADTPKPDYNDGKWHGWNGGVCPVHPEREIDYIWNGSKGLQHQKKVKAGECRPAFTTVGKYHMIAFRVVKPYVEPKKPREFLISMDNSHIHPVPSGFKPDGSATSYIHVREVTK